MSEVAEKLEQVRTALEHYASVDNWNCSRCDLMTHAHIKAHLRDIYCADGDGPDMARAALEALPTAEEMAQMQREAAAWRKLREVIGGKVQLVDAAASARAAAAAKVIEEKGGENAAE